MARGLAKRCPICATRKVWRSWSQLKPACPSCGFPFERESGYWVGAIIVNIAVAETLFALMFFPAMIVTWPEIPWQPLVAIALVTNTVVPFLFYPRSKTTFLAFDLYFNPRRTDEGQSPN